MAKSNFNQMSKTKFKEARSQRRRWRRSLSLMGEIQKIWRKM